jgi:hypothetical protein
MRTFKQSCVEVQWEELRPPANSQYQLVSHFISDDQMIEDLAKFDHSLMKALRQYQPPETIR